MRTPRLPVTEKVAGSNPVGSALTFSQQAYRSLLFCYIARKGRKQALSSQKNNMSILVDSLIVLAMTVAGILLGRWALKDNG